MNKSDLKLILVLLIIFIPITILIISNSSKGSSAEVYHNNKLIKAIDLNINKEYIVNGDNGNVKIIVKDNKIKVDSENSPNHLCSKQGYISSSFETIVCLPNKIVIKIIDDNKLDTKVG